ncbi:MAG: hypothetical protein M0008_12035 [Actinomycetota bacterium]|nr:hypothetical protein [Actinomycetota bacterium]
MPVEVVTTTVAPRETVFSQNRDPMVGTPPIRPSTWAANTVVPLLAPIPAPPLHQPTVVNDGGIPSAPAVTTSGITGALRSMLGIAT